MKTLENIVMLLKLVRCMRGALLAYVVQGHIKVTHVPPGSGAYLTLDEEMITRAPIVDTSLNLRLGLCGPPG